MSDKYNSGAAYKAMLKLFREAKLDMDKDRENTTCLRCNDTREFWVWKDTSETEKIKVDCPMCSVQRPPEELRAKGLI
jgi:Zn finger protein HypA/HybF involved in hydrogenase expression